MHRREGGNMGALLVAVLCCLIHVASSAEIIVTPSTFDSLLRSSSANNVYMFDTGTYTMNNIGIVAANVTLQAPGGLGTVILKCSAGATYGLNLMSGGNMINLAFINCPKAVQVTAGTGTLTNCNFNNNNVAIWSQADPLIVTDSVFNNNLNYTIMTPLGSAIFTRVNITGESIGIISHVTTTITGCVFANTNPVLGLEIVGANATITKTDFYNYNAFPRGVWINGGEVHFTKCNFYNTYANMVGELVFLQGSDVYFEGCNVTCSDISNCGYGLNISGGSVSVSNTAFSNVGIFAKTAALTLNGVTMKYGPCIGGLNNNLIKVNGSTFETCNDFAIQVDTTTTLTLTANSFTGSSGIKATPVTGATLTSNKFNDGISTGITIVGQSFITIESNKFTNGVYTGSAVALNSAGNCNVNFNQATAVGLVGGGPQISAVFNLNCTNTSFVGNTIVGTTVGCVVSQYTSVGAAAVFYFCRTQTIKDNVILAVSTTASVCSNAMIITGMYIAHTNYSELSNNTIGHIYPPQRILGTVGYCASVSASAVLTANSSVMQLSGYYHNLHASDAQSCDSCFDVSGTDAAAIVICSYGNTGMRYTLSNTFIEKVYGGRGGTITNIQSGVSTKRDIEYYERGGGAYGVHASDLGITVAVGNIVMTALVGGDGGAYSALADCNGGLPVPFFQNDAPGGTYTYTDTHIGQACRTAPVRITGCGVFASASAYELGDNINFTVSPCLVFKYLQSFTFDAKGYVLNCTGSCDWAIAIFEGDLTISNAVIYNSGIINIGGSLTKLVDSTINGAGIGLNVNGSVLATRNTFTNCQVGINLGEFGSQASAITNNSFVGSTLGAIHADIKTSIGINANNITAAQGRAIYITSYSVFSSVLVNSTNIIGGSFYGAAIEVNIPGVAVVSNNTITGISTLVSSIYFAALKLSATSDLRVYGNQVSDIKIHCVESVGFLQVVNSAITMYDNKFYTIYANPSVSCEFVPVAYGIVYDGATGTSTADYIYNITTYSYGKFATKQSSLLAVGGVGLVNSSNIEITSLTISEIIAPSTPDCASCNSTNGFNAVGIHLVGGSTVKIFSSSINRIVAGSAGKLPFQSIEKGLINSSAIGGSAYAIASYGNTVNVQGLTASNIIGGNGRLYLYLKVDGADNSAAAVYCNAGKGVLTDGLTITWTGHTFSGTDGIYCAPDGPLVLLGKCAVFPQGVHDVTVIVNANLKSYIPTLPTCFRLMQASNVTIMTDSNMVFQCSQFVRPFVQCNPVIAIANSQNVVVSGFTFDGTPGVVAYNSSVTIQDLIVFDMANASFLAAIHAENTSVVLKNNTVRNSNASIYVSTPPWGFASITNNNVVNGGRMGILVNAPSGTITGNSIVGGSYASGLYIIASNVGTNATFQISNNIVRDIRLEGNGTAIGFVGNPYINVRVLSNSITNVSYPGASCKAVSGVGALLVANCNTVLLASNFIAGVSVTESTCPPFLAGLYISQVSQVEMNNDTVQNLFSSTLNLETRGGSSIVLAGVIFNSTTAVAAKFTTVSALQVANTPNCGSCTETSGYAVSGIVASSATITFQNLVMNTIFAGSAGDSPVSHRAVGGEAFAFYDAGQGKFLFDSTSVVRNITAGNGGKSGNATSCAGGFAHVTNTPESVSGNTNIPGEYIINGKSCIDNPCQNNGGCDPLTVCSVLNQVAVCSACPNGYNGTGVTGCKDFDECDVPNICTGGLFCVNSVGGYSCNVCPAGYTGVKDKCTDINECLNANGGCDRHVTCQNTEGSFICPPCPFGYSGNSANASCTPLCGNKRCEPELLETCVTCPFDCENATCGACGDGVCDLNENCQTCFEDCKGIKCTLACTDPTCSGNGKCTAGICVCNGDFTGPTCASRNKPVDVGVGGSNNDSSVIVIPNPQTSFTISIKSLIEKTPSKVEVAAISLKGLQYSFKTSNTSYSIDYTFFTTLKNQANITIFVRTFTKTATISFANTSATFAKDTIKISSEIQNWPFQNVQNSLHAILDARDTLQEVALCNIAEHKDNNGSVKWVIININGVSMYGQFLEQATIDGKNRNISFDLNTDGSVSAVLPHFWRTALMDPSYSVLVDSEGYESTCDKKSNGVSKNVYIIVFSLFGGLLIMAVVGYFVVYPRVQLALQVRGADKRQSKGMKMSDMTASPSGTSLLDKMAGKGDMTRVPSTPPSPSPYGMPPSPSI